MFTLRRVLPALALATLIASPACASSYYPRTYPQAGPRVADREYDRGFRDGVLRGEQDARRGRTYDVWRHREYRNADNRPGRRDAPVTVYAFREGFEAGYAQGYERVRRGGYGYPPDARPYPPAAGGYPGGGPAGGVLRPFDIGYRDGFEEGARDVRNRDRYDPVRSRRYREGDHDYDRRYGARDDYKRDYRAGFMRGYEDAYRRR